MYAKRFLYYYTNKPKTHGSGTSVTVHFLLFQQNKTHCHPNQPTEHSSVSGNSSEADRWQNYMYAVFFTSYDCVLVTERCEMLCKPSLLQVGLAGQYNPIVAIPIVP